MGLPAEIRSLGGTPNYGPRQGLPAEIRSLGVPLIMVPTTMFS
jgi:hypothetical protein